MWKSLKQDSRTKSLMAPYVTAFSASAGLLHWSKWKLFDTIRKFKWNHAVVRLFVAGTRLYRYIVSFQTKKEERGVELGFSIQKL